MLTCLSSGSISYQGNLSLILMFFTEESDFIVKHMHYEFSIFHLTVQLGRSPVQFC